MFGNSSSSTTTLQHTAHISLAACTENTNGASTSADFCDIDASGLELVSYTVPGLLFDQARSSPDELAIDSYECQWTYAQLELNVKLATTLFAKGGISSGNRVGLCFHLSPWAVVSILAIMNIGAAVVPVDPVHPLARQLTMLREAGVEQLVLKDSDHAEEFASFEFAVIDVSPLESEQVHDSTKYAGLRAHPSHAAFIPFTSGSTGKPKGIVQSHEALVTMSKALGTRLGVTASSRVAQFHPYIFDVSIMEIGMTFASGATLCITKKNDMMLPAPAEVSHQLTQSAITHVTLSPTMLSTMEPSATPTVQVLSVMGEPLGRGAIEKWADRPGLVFLQLFGCTEASILQSITPPITRTSASQDIGTAIQEVCRLWIVDPVDVNTLAPQGKMGELVVESRALATGYLNRPSETAEVFLEHVDWKDPRSKGHFYKTGDLARKETDGSITFLGRQDSQMNYHGERIELGEIDFYLDRARPSGLFDYFADFHVPSQTVVAFLCGLPSTSEHVDGDAASALPWDRAPLTRTTVTRLVGCLLKNGDLPKYMVPGYWIPIRCRPLTASGKTDRTCLKQILEGLSSAQWKECEISDSII